jgi:hypothetical protein
VNKLIRKFFAISVVVFGFCFAASFQNAFANNISLPVTHAGQTPDVDDLNFPGTPLPDYAFPWSRNFFSSTLSPLDSGFWSFGLKEGTFLVTGNTYFNFTGDQWVSIIEFGSDRETSHSNLNNTISAAPEPESAWLFLGAFGVMFGLSVVRIRLAASGGQLEQSVPRD